jgi:hypothetical protein
MFPSRKSSSIPDSNSNNPPHQNYSNLRRRSNRHPSPSGGGGSSSDHPIASNTTTKVPNMYYPKIYTYKCYGQFKTTSNTDNGNHGGGQCYGISKAMETLYDEPIRMTRIEALQRFTSMNSDIDLDDYQNHSSQRSNDTYDNNSNAGNSELSEQTVFLSPALIYKHDIHANDNNPNHNTTEIKKDLTNVEQKTGDEDNNDIATKNRGDVIEGTKEDQSEIANKKSLIQAKYKYYDDHLLEEELILDQDWTCFGVTDVEYLSLENARTGESKLVAVAPRNTGLSIRNIETEDHLRTLTRCSLGWIDILHDSNSVVAYDDDDETNDNKNDDGKKVKSLADIMKAKNDQIDEEIRRTPSIFAELQIPKDIQSIVTVGKQHIDRTIEFSKLVSTHVKYNAEWVYENLKDDFPNRTMNAGKRIMVQLPITIDGTISNMKKIIRQISGIGGPDDDDDDGQNDNFPPKPSSGRRF